MLEAHRRVWCLEVLPLLLLASPLALADVMPDPHFFPDGGGGRVSLPYEIAFSVLNMLALAYLYFGWNRVLRFPYFFRINRWLFGQVRTVPAVLLLIVLVISLPWLMLQYMSPVDGIHGRCHQVDYPLNWTLGTSVLLMLVSGGLSLAGLIHPPWLGLTGPVSGRLRALTPLLACCLAVIVMVVILGLSSQLVGIQREIC